MRRMFRAAAPNRCRSFRNASACSARTSARSFFGALRSTASPAGVSTSLANSKSSSVRRFRASRRRPASSAFAAYVPRHVHAVVEDAEDADVGLVEGEDDQVSWAADAVGGRQPGAAVANGIEA